MTHKYFDDMKTALEYVNKNRIKKQLKTLRILFCKNGECGVVSG